MISNCGHDENGAYSGGRAGDQTGGEWTLREWYSRPWNCVLRHPDAEVRKLHSDLATEAAKNDYIGYDQSQRYTFEALLQAAGWHPANIKTACETDCSEGIIAITKAIGHLTNRAELINCKATYTGDMRACYKASGYQVLTDSKYLTTSEYLLPGDILLNDQHHVCTNITAGAKAEEPAQAKVLNETPKFKGVVNYHKITVRCWAGWNYSKIKSYPYLLKGKEVEVCDSLRAANGVLWYFILIDGSILGFVAARYIKRTSPNYK